jgi:hypothetical protein
VEHQKIIEEITDTLFSLEEQGELVLTTVAPGRVAEVLFCAAVKAKFNETFDEPMEGTMPHLLDLTSKELSVRFGVDLSRSRQIVNIYYKKWLETRTIAEVAEIYWHQTPHEMAGRAYYHIELAKSDDRDLDYLDWRQTH